MGEANGWVSGERQRLSLRDRVSLRGVSQLQLLSDRHSDLHSHLHFREVPRWVKIFTLLSQDKKRTQQFVVTKENLFRQK